MHGAPEISAILFRRSSISTVLFFPMSNTTLHSYCSFVNLSWSIRGPICSYFVSVSFFLSPRSVSITSMMFLYICFIYWLFFSFYLGFISLPCCDCMLFVFILFNFILNLHLLRFVWFGWLWIKTRGTRFYNKKVFF